MTRSRQYRSQPDSNRPIRHSLGLLLIGTAGLLITIMLQLLAISNPNHEGAGMFATLSLLILAGPSIVMIVLGIYRFFTR